MLFRIAPYALRSAPSMATVRPIRAQQLRGSVQGQWAEAMLLVFLASTLLFVMTQPAFRSFFFSENFIYLAQYQKMRKGNGNESHQVLRNGICFPPGLSNRSVPLSERE